MAKVKNTGLSEKDNINTSAASGMDGGKTRMSIGIVIMLMGVFAAVFVSIFSESESLNDNIIMLSCMFVCLTLGAFGLKTLSIVLTGLSVAAFFAVKIYLMAVTGAMIPVYIYLWIVIPVLSLVGITVFSGGFELLKVNNNVLMQQINELAIIDSLTGLYNLRGLYMDAQTQISYAERNGNSITLMIVRLRYPEEMKAVLKRDQYGTVIKRLSALLVDTVRLEDKVYSIDKNGEFAILLTCDRKGAKIVEKRIRTKAEDPNWLSGIASKRIRGDIKLGYLEYNKDRYHRDISGFLEGVREEAEYDV